VVKALWVAILVAALLAVGTAMACVPDLDGGVVTWNVPAGQSATLLVIPDGSGASFTEARGANGMLTNATVTLTLVNSCGELIGFPQEDMWLESEDQGLVLCAGGSTADHATDQNGQSTWTVPLKAGGHSQAACRVVVNGTALPGSSALPLHFNSPDLNGDRVVSLTDIPLFAAAFHGPYAFAADLHFDGNINLTDIPLLAQAMGARCP
jgi:hypothetical protein